MSDLNRFFEKFQDWILPIPESGCWIWMGYCTDKGYARRSINGKKTLVHRAAYAALNGNIPDGKEPDHLCRVRCCVNPYHLEAVSHQENVHRGISIPAKRKRQTHCIRGHELVEGNIYKVRTRPNARHCKTCHFIRKHKGTLQPKDMRRLLAIARSRPEDGQAVV